MGIENTAGAHSPFGIMKLQARRELRAIFVWKTMPYEPTPANAAIGRPCPSRVNSFSPIGRDDLGLDRAVLGEGERAFAATTPT